MLIQNMIYDTDADVNIAPKHKDFNYHEKENFD